MKARKNWLLIIVLFLIGSYFYSSGFFYIGELLIIAALIVLIFGKKKNKVSAGKTRTIKTQYGELQVKQLDASRKLPDSYVAFDFETTGLSKTKDKIIEVGAVKVRKGQKIETFSELVNPEMNITKEITEITGITNSDVWDAPTQWVIIPEFCRFFEGFPLVAHNADFDIGFLAKAIQDCGGDADLQYCDTLELSREKIPGLQNYKLATLIREFNLADGDQTHRALDDAMAVTNLFELIRQMG